MHKLQVITDEDPVMATIKADIFIKGKDIIKVISYPYGNKCIILIHYTEDDLI